MGRALSKNTYHTVSSRGEALRLTRTDSFATGMIAISSDNPLAAASSRAVRPKQREYTRYPGWVILIAILGPSLLFWGSVIAAVCSFF